MSLGTPERVTRRRRRSGTPPMASRIRHTQRVPAQNVVVGSLPPQPGSSRVARAATILVDVLLQVGCATVALLLAGSPGIAHFGSNTSALILTVLYGALWGVAAYSLGLYREELRRPIHMLWAARLKVAIAVFAVIGVAALIGVADPSLGRSAMWALVLSAGAGGLIGALTEKFLIPTKWQRERALLIGTEESIARAAKRLDEHDCRLDVVGTLALDLHEHSEPTTLGTGAGPERRVVDQVRALDASVVILTTDAYLLGMHPMQVIWALESTGAVLIADTGMHTMPNRRVALERVGGLVTVKARRRPRRTAGSTLSGLVQWFGALIGLVVLSPFVLALSIWIRRDSPGGAFYIQERVGLNGKPFRMYKFRTMIAGAHRHVHELVVDPEAPNRGPLVKVKKDPRITRIGSLLRKSSLDELPQLINVVRGEMRLVGPRPALATEVAKYRGYEDRRLARKPGMTGLWQVSGRSDLDWARSVELDQKYVDGHSLGLDAYIVCRTPGAVASSRGAY